MRVATLSIYWDEKKQPFGARSIDYVDTQATEEAMKALPIARQHWLAKLRVLCSRKEYAEEEGILTLHAWTSCRLIHSFYIHLARQPTISR